MEANLSPFLPSHAVAAGGLRASSPSQETEEVPAFCFAEELKASDPTSEFAVASSTTEGQRKYCLLQKQLPIRIPIDQRPLPSQWHKALHMHERMCFD